MNRLVLLGLLAPLLALVPALRVATSTPAPSQKENSVPIGPTQTAESPRLCHRRPCGSKEPKETPLVLGARLAGIEAETDSERRDDALAEFVRSVPDAELRTVLDTLLSLDGDAAGESRRALARRWAALDAPAAADWVSHLSEGAARRDVIEQVAVIWGGADLAHAESWLHDLPEGDGKQQAMLSLAYEAARAEPLRALELGCALPPTPRRDALLTHAASQWAATDFGAAAGWVERVVDFKLRQQLVAAVAIAGAEQSPIAAATLTARALQPGEDQDRVAVAIVQRWAEQSPNEAASWIVQFPDVLLRHTAAQNLVRIWAARDPEKATDWLNQLRDPSLRNAGMSAYEEAMESR